jgi:hypothetical protein
LLLSHVPCKRSPVIRFQSDVCERTFFLVSSVEFGVTIYLIMSWNRLAATTRFMKVAEPRFVPWSSVASWNCDGCGECCKWFTVPVTMHEYARISHRYGHDVVTLGLARAYLRKRPDGRCILMHIAQYESNSKRA